MRHSSVGCLIAHNLISQQCRCQISWDVWQQQWWISLTNGWRCCSTTVFRKQSHCETGKKKKFYNTQCRSGQNISAFASNPQQWWNGVFLERVLTPTLKICIKNTPAVTTYKALSLSESSLELQQVKRRGRIPSHWLILAWHAHIRYFCLCACVAFSMVSLTQHEPVWFQIWSVTDSRGKWTRMISKQLQYISDVCLYIVPICETFITFGSSCEPRDLLKDVTIP